MYVIKFQGTRGNPEQFLIKRGTDYFIGSEKDAEPFEDNEAAVDAALKVTKQIAMLGLPTRIFNISYVKPEKPAAEETKKK